MNSLHKVKQCPVINKRLSRSGSECILAWRSWRIHASIFSARGCLAPPMNAESDIMREKMHDKQTGTRLGTRPPACYDVTGILLVTPCLLTYPRKQTRGNEFIPCSNNICDILKRFRSFKITAITLIWPKSSYKHSVTRSYRSGKESGRRSESPLWRYQWRSFVFITHADDVKREIRLHISRLLTNQKRESARSMG